MGIIKTSKEIRIVIIPIFFPNFFGFLILCIFDLLIPAIKISFVLNASRNPIINPIILVIEHIIHAI